MGDRLEIQGHNFGYSTGAQRVRFDNVEITEFRVGSSDTRLIVTVPTFTDIPEGGRAVTLTVANGVTSDTRSLTITPASTPVSGNLVDVVWETVVPDTPQTGQPLRLGYRLRSRLGTQRTFTITPTISRAEMLAGVEVHDENEQVIGNRQITLTALQEKLFFVRIPNIPAAGTQFTVSTGAVSGGVTGSDTRSFTVGTAAPQSDPNISLSVASFAAVDDAGNPLPASEGVYDAINNTIRLKSGNFGRMELSATFLVAGTYGVTLIPSGTVSGWTRTLDTPNFQIEANDLQGGSATRVVRFAVQADANAPAATVEVRIQRQGEARDERLSFNLALL
jgi:hypothetical protein